MNIIWVYFNPYNSSGGEGHKSFHKCFLHPYGVELSVTLSHQIIPKEISFKTVYISFPLSLNTFFFHFFNRIVVTHWSGSFILLSILLILLSQ